LNAKNQSENTALLIAISSRSNEIAKALIEAGADFKLKNWHGQTALSQAII
jgi:ankyrin repeat protein